MSKKLNKVQLNRRRIAAAYLDFCQRHAGGNWSDVVVDSNKVVRIDVSQESIEQVMSLFIENQLVAEFGISSSQSMITSAYDAMMNHNGKLTPMGVTWLKDAMAAAVTDKLENPGGEMLQVMGNGN